MTEQPTHADAVVIGGGILGTSVAFWLTRSGLRDVVLIEKNGVATGATGKSAGFVRMHYANPWDAALAHASWQIFRHWDEIVGGECGFVNTGFVFVVPPGLVEPLTNNVKMLQGLGIRTWLVDPSELSAISPLLSAEGVGGVAYEPDSGYADPPSAAMSLARAAVRQGARLLAGVPALGVEVVSGRVAGVRTPAGLIAAPIVVNATGAWAGAFAPDLGLNLPVRPKRIAEVYVRRSPDLRHPVVIDQVSDTYFRPEGQDITIVGGHSVEFGVDPDAYRQDVAPEQVDDIVGRLVQRVPALATAGLLRTVAGVDGFSDDGHLILGAAPGVAGLFLALGGSGTGFKVGPAVGKCLAELITSGAATTADITPFRPERFTSGNLIYGAHSYSSQEAVPGRLAF